MNWKYIIPLVVIGAACEAPIIEDLQENQPIAELVSVINPIEGTSQTPRIFQVSATEANTIDLGNGGSIDFPEDAFVDQNGNPVKGSVDVEWQEFHSLGDIILSGIPMKYDSAGVQNDLVSGGMFTIHASQKGSPVEIAPDKKVGVNVASIQDTPCYNFYEMDEESGNWKYETTKSGEPVKTETAQAPAQTKKPDLLDVDLNTKAFPELANVDIVGWEVKRPLKSEEKIFLKNQSVGKRLIKTDSLGMTLEVKTFGGEILKYPVAPYTLDQAMKDTKANRIAMEEGLENAREFAKEVQAGRVIRSIEIDNFGVYNWDIIYKRENSKPLIAKFNLPSEVDPKLVSLFLISPDENVVVKYDPAGDSRFSFDPNVKNCLIAILPGNKLVSVSDDGFTQARQLNNGQECAFQFKETGIKLNSAKDIMNHMNVLI